MTNTPILPGFHPDPSICRVGERYYLVTSTFEYFPGVPIFTSTDLVAWEQIGNVLDRPSQLRTTPGRAGASSGIYAPTLRHHDGRFWLATTDFGTVSQGHLIVHAEDPSGPWSVPVHTTGAIGIDPDLTWDNAGVCYLTWSDVIRGGISQVPIDPRTGALLGDPKEIWRGTGGAHAEGPHIIRRGQWWYLLAAEGGTSIGHMVTVARSRSVDGPFESAPTNPILTHRSTSSPVQSTGHADVVERADGSWALVHLGTRIRGSFPRWHTNGRETFLAGLEWVDDWPVVREGAFTVPEVARRFEDNFTAPALDARWIAPGAVPAEFALPGVDGLVLSRPSSAGERGTAPPGGASHGPVLDRARRGGRRLGPGGAHRRRPSGDGRANRPTNPSTGRDWPS